MMILNLEEYIMSAPRSNPQRRTAAPGSPTTSSSRQSVRRAAPKAAPSSPNRRQAASRTAASGTQRSASAGRQAVRPASAANRAASGSRAAAGRQGTPVRKAAPNGKKPTGNQTRKAVRKRKRRPSIAAWIISLIALLASGYLILELIRLDILPFFLLLLAIVLLTVLTLGFIFLWLFKTRRPLTRALAGVLVAIIAVISATGGYYVHATEAMFNEITNLTDKKVNIYNTYTMKVANLTDPANLTAGAKVGIVPTLDPQGTEAAVQQLRDKGAVFDVVEFETLPALVDSLYDLSINAIVFPENYHYQIYDIADDENQYNALTAYTNLMDSYMYYTDRDPDSINPSDPVGNIMSDPFAVLISGNDSYGTIDSVSRSDVNMVVVVNPKTAQILMINIPRDSYVPVSCKKAPSACADISGENDKLTHTGIYGVGVTESTVEDLLDMKINYYVRVNFSSLVNLVDSVGGIDVDIPEGQEVETFYSNGSEGVSAGRNHLDGERALAFARERHAYIDGDNQRIQNQAMVMRALIQKCLSPSMFVNYPRVVQAVSTAVDTNMSARDLKSLVTLELARRPNWNIQSYAIVGLSEMRYSPSLQADASVMIPIPSTVAYAKALIDECEEGKTVTVDPNGANQYSDLDTPSEAEAASEAQEPQYDIYGNPIDPNAQQYDIYGNPIDPNAQQYDAYGNPIDPNAVLYDEYGNPIY